MLFAIYQEDGPNAKEIRARTRETHLAYLDANMEILVLGGGLIEDDNAGYIGSLLIINVPSREAAEAFSANEPYRKAGLFKSVKITRMRRGQWNPSAAPSSVLGN
jgi:uncharacterized protein YciI